MRGAALILVLAAAAATASGCSRARHAQSGVAPSASPASDYLPAPKVSEAIRRADGAVVLSGTARPGALVRLAAPDGPGLTTQADRSGAWTAVAPAGPAPRLYALSDGLGGRVVRARGYLAVLPSPGPSAVVLRPGMAASPVGPAGAPSMTALDYDASGIAVVSGRARPGQLVRLVVDGREAGEDHADSAGVFEASLSRTLRRGPHVITASGAGLRASAEIVATPPGPIPAGPFTASRAQEAWRIDWITPGGGEQSTVVFDAHGGRA